MIEHDGYPKPLLEIIASGRVIRGVTLQLDYNNPTTVTISGFFYFTYLLHGAESFLRS
jgi:hypothetical protein